MIQKIKSWFRKDEDALLNEITRLTHELSIAQHEISLLLAEKKDLQATQLRAYLKRGCTETLHEVEQLIETDEALKHFGKMWGPYKADTMMMLTAIEYDYIQNYDFTEAEVKVLKHTIGNIGLFLARCKKAHDTRIELQKLREDSK